MTREDREDAIDIIQSILDKYEEDECLVTEITIGDEDIKAFKMAIKALEQEIGSSENLTDLIIKNDPAVDCIDRAELLKAMDTWDKFGYTARYGLERLDKDDKDFVPYVKYDDMVNCVKNMPPVTPQEPKPMVEIDLYSVIKQKYIEREVLDKIRAEIEQTSETIDGFLMHDGTKKTVLKIIDKYKAESEGQAN